METNIITRFFQFVRTSYSQRIKESVSGLLMGGFGGYNIYFGHLPAELVHTWIGVWLWIKTIFFAFTSSLATAYGAYLIEKHKNRQKKSPIPSKRKNKAA